jgi:peptidoglycan-N-acetylglucosamine deacetylase
MFTFRRFTLLFFVCLLGLNLVSLLGCDTAGDFICANLPWFYLGLALSYIGISVAMAFLPQSGFHYPVICCGDKGDKKIAITFDDGPHPEKTPLLLNHLKRQNVPAAFFLIGKKIEGNEELLRRIDREGHILGIHSWSHSNWFDFFTPAVMKRELASNAKAVAKSTGKTPLLFRPPYGVVNPMLARALKQLPLTVIGWSIRSMDAVANDHQKVMERILKGLHPGGIILLHDHSGFTSEMIEILIEKTREAGYRIVSLDELTEIKAYAD